MTCKKCSKEAIVRILLQCDVLTCIIYYELILKHDTILQKWEMRAICKCVSPNVLIRNFNRKWFRVYSHEIYCRWAGQVIQREFEVSTGHRVCCCKPHQYFTLWKTHLYFELPAFRRWRTGPDCWLISPVKRGGLWQPASLPHMHRVSASGWISFVPRLVKLVCGWLKVPRTDADLKVSPWLKPLG